MPVITLPDGSKREFDGPVCAMDVAESIGPGLAKATICARVDGELKIPPISLATTRMCR